MSAEVARVREVAEGSIQAGDYPAFRQGVRRVFGYKAWSIWPFSRAVSSVAIRAKTDHQVSERTVTYDSDLKPPPPSPSLGSAPRRTP